MQRDMSSPMDATMATRSAGQLVNQQKTVTTTTRAGPIESLRTPYPKYLPAAYRPSCAAVAGIDIPGIGQVSWKGLAFGMGVGVIALMLLRRKKKVVAV